MTSTSVAECDDELSTELGARGRALRPPDVVMQPEVMGAARLTRYSFSRTMLRRARIDGWRARRTRFEVDDEGRGESVYRLETRNERFHFVAFTTTIAESEHTDRVVADRWEITAALVEGELDDDLMGQLRTEVPRQEEGRLDGRVLVLTRGNRSVRFFAYLVDSLAAGEQPNPDHVADAGYIMRSTAFYANGKCGMRSFEGYADSHPFSVPYRAQFATAWLFRELSYDIVEHCAAARGGGRATRFDDEWRRYFGLGNATGLGLVPYAFHHPRVINAWVGVRELALADVRRRDGTSDLALELEGWIRRAHRHFEQGTDDDCHPFLNARALAGKMVDIGDAFSEVRHQARPFDALYRWAEGKDVETIELVVSLLIELHDGDDDLVDRLLRVDEDPTIESGLTAGDALALLHHRFAWLDDLALDADDADACWWVISDNTEEPRRVRRDRLEPNGRDVAIDIAVRLRRLRSALDRADPDVPIAAIVRDHPDHRLAVERLQRTGYPYGEPRDNACAPDFLPLQLQRFQLAMYGMDNFKPKSTDWLRVTLFQGAPRLDELGPDTRDDWVLPPRPRRHARADGA